MKLLLFLGILTISFLAMGTASTYAATFVVDTDANGTDSIPGNAVCETGSGDCTLHAAIQEANALAGPDTINFNIPGGGVRTITPTVDLPDITENLEIDGETQPSAACGTLVPANKQDSNTPHTLLIEIDASQTTNSVLRLESQSEDSTLRGLVINSVQNNMAAMEMTSVNALSNTLIECNYLGTDPTGTSAPSNSGQAIFTDDSLEYSTIRNNLISGNSFGASIDSDASFGSIEGNLIGTTADGNSALGNQAGITLRDYFIEITDNIISGNNGDGIYVTDGGAHTTRGNYIGLGLNGNVLGNTGNGINLSSSWNNPIGGTSSEDANFISGNLQNGILLQNDCSSGGTFDNQITGNFIGAGTDGQYASGYGNQGAGVRIAAYGGACSSTYRNQIGGTESGEANVIVGNGEQGVILHQEQQSSLFGSTIIGNSIYNNGGLSIDLAADDVVDGNGVASADIGLNLINAFDMAFPAEHANNYINHPTINSSTHTNGKVTVNYSFVANSVQDSPPELQASDLVGYRLDFYMSDAKDILGSGQGKTHLGSFMVDGSESGATHELVSPVPLVGDINISATATVLWTNKGATNPCDNVSIYGEAPPYILSDCGG